MGGPEKMAERLREVEQATREGRSGRPLVFPSILSARLLAPTVGVAKNGAFFARLRPRLPVRVLSGGLSGPVIGHDWLSIIIIGFLLYGIFSPRSAPGLFRNALSGMLATPLPLCRVAHL